MKICRCGRAIPDNIPRCSDCQMRHDKDNKDRNRIYNRFKRDKDSQQVYNNPRWEPIKQKARDRDNGLCLVCLLGKRIVSSQAVHHIITIKDNIAKAFNINNLICLCESCHQLVHAQYRKSPKTKKETQVFLFSLIKGDHLKG